VCVCVCVCVRVCACVSYPVNSPSSVFKKYTTPTLTHWSAHIHHTNMFTWRVARRACVRSSCKSSCVHRLSKHVRVCVCFSKRVQAGTSRGAKHILCCKKTHHP